MEESSFENVSQNTEKTTSPFREEQQQQQQQQSVLSSTNAGSISFENIRLKEKVAALSAELVTVKAKCSALQLDNARLKLALSAASSLRTQGGRSRSNTGGSPTSSIGHKDSSTSQIAASASSLALQQLASSNSFYTKTAPGTIEGGGVNGGLPRPPSNSSFLFGMGRDRSETRDRSDTTESISVSGSYRDRGNTCDSEKLSVGNADFGRGRASSTGWEASFNHPSLSPSSSFTPSGSPEPLQSVAVTDKHQSSSTSAISATTSMLRMPSISFSKMWNPSRNVIDAKESSIKTVSFDAEKEVINCDPTPTIPPNHDINTGRSLERLDSGLDGVDTSSAACVVDLDSLSLLDSSTAQHDAVAHSEAGCRDTEESSAAASSNSSPPSHKVSLSSFISGENCSTEANSVPALANVNSSTNTSSSSFSFRFFGNSNSAPPPPPPHSLPPQSNLTVDVGSSANNTKQADTIGSAWGLFGVASSRSTPLHSNDSTSIATMSSSSSSSASSSSAQISSSTSASSSSSIWSALLSSVSLTTRKRFPVNEALLKLPSWSRKRSASVVSLSKGFGDDRLSLARSLFLLQDDHECATITGNSTKLVLVQAGELIPNCIGFEVLSGSVVQVVSVLKDKSEIDHNTTCIRRVCSHNIVTSGKNRFLASSDSLCRIARSRKRCFINALTVSRARDLGLEAPRHDPTSVLLKVNKTVSSASTIENYLATLRRFSDVLNTIPLPKQNTNEPESSDLNQSVSDFSREVGVYLNGAFFPLGSSASFSAFVDALGAALLKDRRETPSFLSFMRHVLIASSRTITGGDSLRLVQENLSSKNRLTFLASEAGGPAEFITTQPVEAGNEESCFYVHLSANNNFRIIADAVPDGKSSSSSSSFVYPGSQTNGFLALLRCTLSEELSTPADNENDISYEDVKDSDGDRDHVQVKKSESLLDRLLASTTSSLNSTIESIVSKSRSINVDFVFV